MAQQQSAGMVCAEPRVHPTTKQNKQESCAHWRYGGISVKIHKIPLVCSEESHPGL